MSRAEWRLLILLVASVFINYIDRSNLSIAAPLVASEMSLSPAQLGSVLGAFFWTYALLQLFGVAGWLVDRYPVGWVFALAFAVWSGATALSGLVTGFTALYLMRLVVGAGESLAYPCYSKLLASEFPQEHRGTANALLDAGSKLGPALGTLAGGYLIAGLGWRFFFVVLGLGSLVWLLPWFRWMPKHGSALKNRGNTEIPTISDIVSKRSAWGAFCGHFCGNYYWFFLLTWLPTYLVKERGFSIKAMAAFAFWVYFAIATATVVAGWASDRWIARGVTPTRARKTVVVSGLLGSTVILPVAGIQDQTIAMGLLILACLAFGTYTSNHWAITQTLAGPHAAGRWTSLQNGIGNLSGIAAPWLTGVVVERTGAFYLAFVVAAVVAFAGAFFWGAVVERVEQQTWRPTAA